MDTHPTLSCLCSVSVSSSSKSFLFFPSQCMAIPFHSTTSLIPTVSTHPPACFLCAPVKVPPYSQLPQQQTPGLPTPPAVSLHPRKGRLCPALRLPPPVHTQTHCGEPAAGLIPSAQDGKRASSPHAPPKCGLGLVPVSTGPSLQLGRHCPRAT